MAVTISGAEIRKKDGVVILPVKEYQRLLANSVPTYYLKGKAALRLDKLVENGLREYREGKTISAGSISEALAKSRRKPSR